MIKSWFEFTRRVPKYIFFTLTCLIFIACSSLSKTSVDNTVYLSNFIKENFGVSEAFRIALDSARNKPLVVEEGIYQLEKTVVIPSNTRILAQGRVVVQNAKNTSHILFDLKSNSNIYIEGLTFENQNASLGLFSNCIYSNTKKGMNNLVVKNCSSVNTGALVLLDSRNEALLDSSNGKQFIHSIIIDGCNAKNTIVPAFEFNSCSDIKILNSKVENCYKKSSSSIPNNRETGIRFINCHDVVIDHNEITRQGEGSGENSNKRIHAMSFEGSFLNDKDTIRTGCHKVTITNNHLIETGGNGITLNAYSDDFVIAHNTINYGRMGEGITIHGQNASPGNPKHDSKSKVSNVLIRDNIISNRGRTPVDGGVKGKLYFENNTGVSRMSGIIIEKGVNVEIVNNEINYCFNGIKVGYESSKVKVVNNQISNSAGPSIITDRCENVEILNNQIKNSSIENGNTNIKNYQKKNKSVIICSGEGNIRGGQSIVILGNKYSQDNTEGIGQPEYFLYHGESQIPASVKLVDNIVELSPNQKLIHHGSAKLGKDIIIEER